MSGIQEAPVTVAIIITVPVTVQQGQRNYTAPAGSVVAVRQVMVSRAAQVLGLQQHERVIEGQGITVGQVIDPTVLPGLISVGVPGIAQPTPPDPLAFIARLDPTAQAQALQKLQAMPAVVAEAAKLAPLQAQASAQSATLTSGA